MEYNPDEKKNIEDLSEEELDQLLRQAEEEYEEQVFEAKEQRRAKLETLAASLEQKIVRRIAERSIVETRWLEDLRQFHGYYGAWTDPDSPVNYRREGRQPPKVNITRNKCLIAMSQMADLQFPGRDKNFSIEPTPVPELDLQVGDSTVIGQDQQGQPVTVGDRALQIQRQASLAAKNMEQKIEDQFAQCHWGPECRESIRDLVILGTAVLKGPVVEATVRKKWNHEVVEGRSVSTFEYEVDNTPTAQRVDPWYFFPDMKAMKPESAEDSFELHPMNVKDLRLLSDHPNFEKQAIKELIEAEPDDIITANLTARHAITGSDVYFKGKYQVWEYHGCISDDVIEALGLENEELRDPLMGYFGEVWFCQGKVLKARLAQLEGDTTIPYVFTQWEPDETTPFGFGIPFLVRDAQRVVNSTWQMIMDNSGLASGPQVVINRDAITPANDRWQIEPHKIWYSNEFGAKPEENIYFFTVPSMSPELSSVMDMAMKFSESEASMPLISQGPEAAQQAGTATGLTMLLDATNVVQKRANRNWDDNITRVMVGRFYDWNMQFCPDPSVKGDFKIVARGSTDLTMRQMKAQDAATLITAAQQNPDLNTVIKMDRLAKLFIESTNVDADEIVKTEQELTADLQAAQENQPPDYDMMKLQIEQEKLALQRDKQEAELQLKHLRIQMEQTKMELTWQQFLANAQADVIAEQSEREQTIMKLAADENMSAQQLLAKIGMAEKAEETKRFLGVTDFAQKARELNLRAKNMEAGNDSFG